MYVYFCDRCNTFEVFEGKTGRFKCSNCGVDFLPLGVSMDEWNGFSNEEMLKTIEQAREPKIEIKKPIMPAPKPEITHKNLYDYENHSADYHRKNKLLIPIIIGAVALVIVGAIFFFIFKNKSSNDTASDKVEEITEEITEEPQVISQKSQIDQLYLLCLSIYEKGDTCAFLAYDNWSVKSTNTIFRGFWEQSVYQHLVNNSYTSQEAKDELNLFWDYKEKIPQELSEADILYKSITNIPEDEQAYFDAVKELYIMVSSYAKQAITFPEGYNELKYGEFVLSNRQEFESLNSRVEIEKQ